MLLAAFRIYREREDIARGALCFGKITGPVPKVAEALVEMERHGVIHLGFDPGLAEMNQKPVPIRHANHELVKDVVTRHPGGPVTDLGEPELGPVEHAGQIRLGMKRSS